MRGRVLGVLAVLSLLVAPAGAETLGDIARARGVPPPDGPGTAAPRLQTYHVLDDARDLLVVYVIGERDAAALHAARWQRAARRWTAAPLDWHVTAGGPRALAVEHCRSGLAIDRSPGGFVVRAHINPSAECTIVLASEGGALHAWAAADIASGSLHYAYVPPELRGNGLARQAIRAALGDAYPDVIDVTHPWPWVSRRYRWNPYPMMAALVAADARREKVA